MAQMKRSGWAAYARGASKIRSTWISSSFGVVTVVVVLNCSLFVRSMTCAKRSSRCSLQLTAFFTSAPILASSAAVSSFSA